MIYSFVQGEILGYDAGPDTPPASPDKSRMQAQASGSKTTLAILTCSAVVAIFAAAGSNATIALGLSYAVIEALAFLLIERALSEAQHGRHNGGSVIYSANGLLSQPTQPAASGTESKFAVVRDVAAASAVATGIAALTLESLSFGVLAHWGIVSPVLGEKWLLWEGVLGVVYALVVIVVQMLMDGALLVMVSPPFDQC